MRREGNGLDNPKGLPLYPRAKIGLLDRRVGLFGSRVAGRLGYQFFLAREVKGLTVIITRNFRVFLPSLDKVLAIRPLVICLNVY